MTELNAAPEKHTHKKPWYRHPATLIAAIAATISLVSAGASVYFTRQANGIAKQQEVAAEQQELLTLVANIAQEPAAIAQESASLHDDSTALHAARVGTQLTELADAEEAYSILRSLPPGDETAEEYYFSTIGLLAGESDTVALSLLRTATTLQPDPRTRANIFRAEALIQYQNNNNSRAESDINLAVETFKGLGVEEYQYNWAYTEFFDAQYQAAIDCPFAQKEVRNAKQLLSAIQQNPTEDITALTDEETTDETIPNINKPIPPVTGGIFSRPCKDL
jgi:hypothetical protein